MESKKVRVRVTKNDIASPWPHFCPIESAIARGVKPGLQIVVGYGGCCIDRNTVALPDKTTSFIKSFDSGVPVKPFSFTVEIPSSLVRSK